MGRAAVFPKPSAAQLGSGRGRPCTDPSLAWTENPAHHGPPPAERQGVQGA